MPDLEYTFSFVPTFYTVKPGVQLRADGPPFWTINRADNDELVGFATNEGNAMMLCMGANLIYHTVRGDRAGQRDILRAIEALVRKMNG